MLVTRGACLSMSLTVSDRTMVVSVLTLGQVEISRLSMGLATLINVNLDG